MTAIKVPGFGRPLYLEFIVWIQGDGNYSRIHYKDGKTFLVSQTLKWFEERMTTFIRIHKSGLINPEHLSELKKEYRQVTVRLSNGVELNVSRRRLDALHEGLMVAHV